MKCYKEKNQCGLIWLEESNSVLKILLKNTAKV